MSSVFFGHLSGSKVSGDCPARISAAFSCPVTCLADTLNPDRTPPPFRGVSGCPGVRFDYDRSDTGPKKNCEAWKEGQKNLSGLYCTRTPGQVGHLMHGRSTYADPTVKGGAMLELTRLWSKTTRDDRPFLAGSMAGVRLFVFELLEPDERGATHRVMLADPNDQQRKETRT